jgi:ribulose bisphosphate carboxylase small subunit
MATASRPYQKVVIDTAPLIDALTLELIEREPKWEATILRISPLHPCLANNPTNQRRFQVLLNSIEEIIVTSHVIGEIKSGRYLKPQEFHNDYWRNCLNFFDMHNVNEMLVTLHDLNNDDRLRQIVRVNGPTDAGLIALAERMLLTNDSDLYKWRGAFHRMEIKLVENLVSY